MKFIITVIAVSVALAFCALGEVAVADNPATTLSKQNAVLAHPDLATPGSKFNEKFLAIINAWKLAKPELLQRDDWPEKAAEAAAAQLPAKDGGTPKEAQAIHIKGPIIGRDGNGVFVSFTPPLSHEAAEKIRAKQIDDDERYGALHGSNAGQGGGAGSGVSGKQTIYLANFHDAFANAVDLDAIPSGLQNIAGKQVPTYRVK